MHLKGTAAGDSLEPCFFPVKPAIEEQLDAGVVNVTERTWGDKETVGSIGGTEQCIGVWSFTYQLDRR